MGARHLREPARHYRGRVADRGQRLPDHRRRTTRLYCRGRLSGRRQGVTVPGAFQRDPSCSGFLKGHPVTMPTEPTELPVFEQAPPRRRIAVPDCRSGGSQFELGQCGRDRSIVPRRGRTRREHGACSRHLGACRARGRHVRLRPGGSHPVGRARARPWVIPLWFGSYKNGMSSYVPGWVKEDITRCPALKCPVNPSSTCRPSERRTWPLTAVRSPNSWGT
jgi:hypothetical protein